MVVYVSFTFSTVVGEINEKSKKLILPLHSAPLKVSISELSGNYIGIITSITFGNITAKLLLDTGSRMLVLPKENCKGCLIKKPYYVPTEKAQLIECSSKECMSITKTLNSCHDRESTGSCLAAITYADGTKWITQSYIDEVIINGSIIPNVLIGAIIGDIGTKQKSMNYGLLGLARCSGDSCLPTIVDSIIKFTGYKNMFGIRVEKDYSGKFTIGEPDLREGESIVYAPLIPSYNEKYFVMPKSIKVLGIDRVVEVPTQLMSPTIVDTGSSISYFSPEIYDLIGNEIGDVCTLENGCDWLNKKSTLGYLYDFIEFTT
ncbi:hypothetical protein PPL_02615 [Heterostelium album PN500]|uniref:Peptidase A1 domain-containing protein n=1 Tax=Heterostelium pallidum (strain ATCC 26659 / Pp 5 / PN500) TaxID=670386 RepID=D3B2K2_HETP5|nr:hypothetical protein PPL_02615 [Heterostelium album PN500]EFA83550.1 hypothetical protein PPL_02615 [Heterostelium album PN500]|eukprot:XP_020435667.1 hypothetical protein PPL_02615 [Heterostelium album PN500]